MRLFVAVDLPEAAKESLAKLTQAGLTELLARSLSAERRWVTRLEPMNAPAPAGGTPR